jgi:hypothetical protein
MNDRNIIFRRFFFIDPPVFLRGIIDPLAFNLVSNSVFAPHKTGEDGDVEVYCAWNFMCSDVEFVIRHDRASPFLLK